MNAAVLAPTDLDLLAAARQAIGPSYVRPENGVERLTAYWEGKVRLPPHPEWRGADVTDWMADPFSDRNWQFQHHTLRWLNPLRWAALDGDERARAEWLRVARSWFEANVPAKIARAAFAWKDMADGNRAINLSLGAALADAEDDWFVELLVAHRDWLMDEAHIVGKNHGLHQHAGLFVVAAVLRDEQAMDTATRRMTDQFVTAFDAQGANDEGSAAYHQMNLRWWTQSWQRVQAEGRAVPEVVTSRLLAASSVLAHLSLPSGRVPQIGDSSRGSVIKGSGPESDFVATQGRGGTRPQSLVKVLDGGYAISRSGWGESRALAQESHLVLRHGVDLKAHSHADRGSVHVYAAGTPWLVDSGFYSYGRGEPIRQHLKSRRAHNVAMLAGAEHDDAAPVTLERAKATGEVHDFVVVDRGYGPAVVTRRVVYLTGPDCWIVWDTTDSQEHRLIHQWHTEPGLSAQRNDRGFRLRSGDSALHMSWLGPTPVLRRREAAESDLRGWIGTKWKTLQPGTLITAEAKPQSRGLALLIAPSHGVPLGIVDSHLTLKGALTTTVTRGGSNWAVRIDDEVSVSEVTAG